MDGCGSRSSDLLLTTSTGIACHRPAGPCFQRAVLMSHLQLLFGRIRQNVAHGWSAPPVQTAPKVSLVSTTVPSPLARRQFGRVKRVGQKLLSVAVVLDHAAAALVHRRPGW